LRRFCRANACFARMAAQVASVLLTVLKVKNRQAGRFCPIGLLTGGVPGCGLAALFVLVFPQLTSQSTRLARYARLIRPVIPAERPAYSCALGSP
jgi:hypothetical protein